MLCKSRCKKFAKQIFCKIFREKYFLRSIFRAKFEKKFKEFFLKIRNLKNFVFYGNFVPEKFPKGIFKITQKSHKDFCVILRDFQRKSRCKKFAKQIFCKIFAKVLLKSTFAQNLKNYKGIFSQLTKFFERIS